MGLCLKTDSKWSNTSADVFFSSRWYFIWTYGFHFIGYAAEDIWPHCENGQIVRRSPWWMMLDWEILFWKVLEVRYEGLAKWFKMYYFENNTFVIIHFYFCYFYIGTRMKIPQYYSCLALWSCVHGDNIHGEISRFHSHVSETFFWKTCLTNGVHFYMGFFATWIVFFCNNCPQAS